MEYWTRGKIAMDNFTLLRVKDCLRLVDIAVTQLERYERQEALTTLGTLRGGLNVLRGVMENPLTREQVREIKRYFGMEED